MKKRKRLSKHLAVIVEAYSRGDLKSFLKNQLAELDRVLRDQDLPDIPVANTNIKEEDLLLTPCREKVSQIGKQAYAEITSSGIVVRRGSSKVIAIWGDDNFKEADVYIGTTPATLGRMRAVCCSFFERHVKYDDAWTLRVGANSVLLLSVWAKAGGFCTYAASFGCKFYQMLSPRVIPDTFDSSISYNLLVELSTLWNDIGWSKVCRGAVDTAYISENEYKASAVVSTSVGFPKLPMIKLWADSLETYFPASGSLEWVGMLVSEHVLQVTVKDKTTGKLYEAMSAGFYTAVSGSDAGISSRLRKILPRMQDFSIHPAHSDLISYLRECRQAAEKA